MMNTDTKQQIETALRAFSGSDLRTASIGLLNSLGYQSEKTLNISSLAELREYLDPHEYLTEENALFSRWSDVRFLFQLTNAEIAKNYLNEEEVDELNRIAVMWLDFAEDQAKRRKQVFMKDWEQKLDEFLRFNERKVLPNAGKMSKQDAEEHTKAEYEQFEVRRRAYKESIGEAETIKHLEEAAK